MDHPLRSDTVVAPDALSGVMTEPEILVREAGLRAARRAALGQKADDPLFGVALSGGGIRSATFNLGILQTLVQHNLLPKIDYLSTVSGGGYIGSFLHGVIQGFGDGDPRAVNDVLGRPDDTPHHQPVDDPIAFLRQYSSYLAPQTGLFSADFWQIVAIWVRNTFLNQLMLIPLLAGLGVLLFLVGNFWQSHGVWLLGSAFPIAGVQIALPWLGLILLSGAGYQAYSILATEARLGRDERGAEPLQFQRDGNTAVAGLFFTGSAAMAFGYESLLFTFDRSSAADWFGFLSPGVLAMVALFCVVERCGANAKISIPRLLSYAVGSGVAAIGCLFAAALVLFATRQWEAQHVWIDLAYGPPLGVVAFGFGFSVHIGLMGTDYRDSVREWFARLASQMLILALAWAAAFSMMVFGPWWLMKFVIWAGAAGGGALIVSWLGTTAAGILTGQSASTAKAQDGQSAVGRAKEIVAGIVPAVFVGGLLLLLGFGSFLLLAPRDSAVYKGPPATAAQGANVDLTLSTSTPEGRANISVSSRSKPSALTAWVTAVEKKYWDTISDERLRTSEGVYLVVVIILIFIGQCRFDINEFSMQRFYSNRLIRCYLGAGRGRKRNPSLSTGFDPKDEIAIGDLSPEKNYFGPQPIVNCTVNLTRGEELARMERKGESFSFTPVACGYALPEAAFYQTKDYMGGPALGLVTGVSGAAANPNWGYHTTPSVAFLLTFFNVRLGWWVGNPKIADCARKTGPPHSLVPLYNELTSNLGISANWLNLSDGGHFENLGIYELVRRRCKYIIVGDGEQDEKFTFESLGGAVRKCRTDFGVEIDIDPAGILPKEGKLSATHCVVGSIRYPLLPCEKNPLEGKLLYLKASLTGDEPADVLQYRSVHDDFPHETTVNQFFTESQFESYRKLGRHVAKSALEVIADNPTNPLFSDIAKVFTLLAREWFPLAVNVSAEANVGHTREWARVIGLLLQDEKLKSIRPAILEWTAGATKAKSYDLATDEGLAIHKFYLEIIQLMENVWADLDLKLHGRRHGPQFRGWIKVFKRWVDEDNGPFNQAWELAKNDYTPLFEHFIQQLRSEELSDL